MVKPRKKKASKTRSETENSSQSVEPTDENVMTERKPQEDIAEPVLLPTPPTIYLDSLPDSLKNLTGIKVKIQNEETQHMIEFLGNLLGIFDYKTNMISFWFLDTIALQVLQTKEQLTDHYRGILISWLVGEMNYIREKRCSREEFFHNMEDVFLQMEQRLLAGKPLFYWEEIMPENKMDEMNETIHRSSSVLKNPKRRVNLKDENNKHGEDSIFKLTSNSRRENMSKGEGLEDIIQLSKEEITIDVHNVLDTLISATYDMYGNEFRYDLIQTVIVEPVEVHTYRIPYTFRKPRPVKITEIGETLQLSIHQTLSQLHTESQENKVKKPKTNKGKTASKKQVKKNSIMEIVPPPPSLTDEELLRKKREYILPLMDAKEASDVLKMFDDV
ncbi:uncharacterized protein LOC105703564 [Orussus abietinus]|uniref:uncharacterized protein LOC105703564 n=1 Tax=Orussus abietinus TaxID=222816 RepID=UPI000625DFA4|nr:uncharacterized protein LOC105703564 [Orussus abietinus]